MAMDPFIFSFPKAPSHKNFLKKMPNIPEYTISFERGEKWPAVLLDTFDAELLDSAKMLFQLEEKLLCFDVRTGQMVEQAAPKKWSFAVDLPEGPVTSQLTGVSNLRAFLPVAEIDICLLHGLLLDDEQKTRARLSTLSMQRGQKVVGVGSTVYLRGYGQAHTDLCRWLEKLGAIPCPDVGQVFAWLDIKREIYTAKPTVQIHPDAPARESAVTIINAFMQTARRNENGVVADYDTEFLHDYRVSFRKVRSVLSLFKGVFEVSATARLKKDFASLMQKTNTLRDLDVYLLNKEQCFSLVPTETHEGLHILFDYLAGERKKQHKSVSKFIRSKVYLEEIDRLEKLFADSSALAGGPKGQEKSLVFASGLILKRYTTVCKIARSIDEKTSDEGIHQLRINCKKLRYLMEFFAPLFAKDDMKTLVKALKSLQDNLGNFNDYSVQQIFLRQILREKMSGFRGAELKVAESVGALTAMLYGLQSHERGQVMKNFILFDSSDTRTIFTKLFHTEESVHEDNSLLQ
ncbi:CHAD domain-containing protein [Desulfocastanea catecholica]